MAAATSTATLVRSRPWWYAFRRGRWFGYIYGGPVIIAFLVFNLYPMTLGLYLSFTRWDILSPPTFNGWNNWADLLKDDLLWRAVLQTLYYALASVTGATALSIARLRRRFGITGSSARSMMSIARKNRNQDHFWCGAFAGGPTVFGSW